MTPNFTQPLIAVFTTVLIIFSHQTIFAQQDENINGKSLGSNEAIISKQEIDFKNNKITIQWQMKVSASRNHFEIERSFDQIHYKTIGIVLDGMMLDQQTQNFAFKDVSSSFAGKVKVYYRFREINVTGTSKYYESIEVNLSNNASMAIDAMPRHWLNKKYTKKYICSNFLQNPSINLSKRMLSQPSTSGKVFSGNAGGNQLLLSSIHC